MLDAWVGREARADDEVSLAGARRMAALLDRAGGARADWKPAPTLGQHSVEVLRECGLSGAEIARLIAVGATIDGQYHES